MTIPLISNLFKQITRVRNKEVRTEKRFKIEAVCFRRSSFNFPPCGKNAVRKKSHIFDKKKKSLKHILFQGFLWLRGRDLNHATFGL